MIALLAAVVCAAGQDPNSPVGASRVLDRLARIEARPTPIEAAQFALDAFVVASAQMPPESAAAQWMRLLDRWEKAQKEPSFHASRTKFVNLGWEAPAAAIPPPNAWPIIRKLLDDRPASQGTSLFRLYFDRLLGKKADAESGTNKIKIRTQGPNVVLASFHTSTPPQESADPNDRNRLLSALLARAEATEDPKLTDQVISQFERSTNSSNALDLIRLTIRERRYRDAERLILSQAANPRSHNRGWEPALELMSVYYSLNRPTGVAALLDGFHNWPSADLFDLVELNLRDDYDGDLPLGFYAAWAFAGTGRKDLAVRTLHDLLRFDLRIDEAYRLLNELEGAPALHTYDDLTKLDRFEARTVAWKADLLRRLGRLPEAEAAARHAISMDPTDGQAAAGHRLVSFTILASILETEGKTQEAAKYKQIVHAVRLAERADRFRAANLLPQAEDLYRQAVAMADKGYCMHARLAVTLQSEGKPGAAALEFRRAYELLPDSMGKLSSSCLGCQGMFEGEVRQMTALEVFSRLAESSPEKPQLPYLIGQIYEEMGRSTEAAVEYQRAIQLDPDYLDAVDRLQGLGQKGLLPVIAAEVGMADLRLEAFGRHRIAGSMKYVTDFSAVWNLLNQVRKSMPSLPQGHLYSLHAADRSSRAAYYRIDQPIGARIAAGPSAALTWMDPFSGILRDPPKQ